MNVRTVSIIIVASAMILFAEATRRRTAVPRYVHVLAISIGVLSAWILRRGGGLHSDGFGNALQLLVPPAAVYYFFFREGAAVSQ